jgi:hypothetical protein
MSVSYAKFLCCTKGDANISENEQQKLNNMVDDGQIRNLVFCVYYISFEYS